MKYSHCNTSNRDVGLNGCRNPIGQDGLFSGTPDERKKTVFPHMVMAVYSALQIEWFSTECRKTQTKVSIITNHNRRKQRNEPIRDLKQTRATGVKRGKTRASEARLVSVLLLIG